MFTGPVEDRAAIRDLIDTYTDAVYQRNPTAWADTWAEDGVWTLGSDDTQGKVAITEAWKKAMEGIAFVAFTAHPGMIKVHGSLADARVYTSEFIVTKDGAEIRINGQYDDKLAKESGRWHFKSRRYTILRRV